MLTLGGIIKICEVSAAIRGPWEEVVCSGSLRLKVTVAVGWLFLLRGSCNCTGGRSAQWVLAGLVVIAAFVPCMRRLR